MAKVQLGFLVINRLDLVVVSTWDNELPTGPDDEGGAVDGDLEGACDDEEDEGVLGRVAVGLFHARREDEDPGSQEGALLEDGGDLEFLLGHHFRTMLVFADGNQPLSLTLIVIIHHGSSDIDFGNKPGPLQSLLHRRCSATSFAGFGSFGSPFGWLRWLSRLLLPHHINDNRNI